MATPPRDILEAERAGWKERASPTLGRGGPALRLTRSLCPWGPPQVLPVCPTPVLAGGPRAQPRAPCVNSSSWWPELPGGRGTPQLLTPGARSALSPQTWKGTACKGGRRPAAPPGLPQGGNAPRPSSLWPAASWGPRLTDTWTLTAGLRGHRAKAERADCSQITRGAWWGQTASPRSVPLLQLPRPGRPGAQTSQGHSSSDMGVS